MNRFIDFVLEKLTITGIILYRLILGKCLKCGGDLYVVDWIKGWEGESPIYKCHKCNGDS